MKIEKINENKIKVTISLSDLRARNIDLNSLNYNSPAAQELFWDMMEQAENKFGFRAADAHLCIEAVSDDDESFNIFITRVSQSEDDFESIQKYIKDKFKKTDLRVKKKGRANKLYSPIMIYSFADFEDLRLMCKKIQSLYFGESSLYKYKNFYCIVLTKSNWLIANSKAFENILSEFGNKMSNTHFCEGFLCEHGIKIADGDALEIINSYF